MRDTLIELRVAECELFCSQDSIMAKVVLKRSASRWLSVRH